MDNLNEQFSRIYDQYTEKIYRFVYLKVNSQEIAEDITSGVFTKGWKYYQGNQEIKSIGAFLYRIARNDVINHYKDKGKTKLVSSDYIVQMADNKADLHQKAVLNSDMEAVKLAIQSLKKDYQDVIIWHYLEDVPVAEISDILGKPDGTIRVMIHRALKSLKEQFNQES